MLQVGAPRFELGTSALSGLRSNQMSYAPDRCRRWRPISQPELQENIDCKQDTGAVKGVRTRQFWPVRLIALPLSPVNAVGSPANRKGRSPLKLGRPRGGAWNRPVPRFFHRQSSLARPHEKPRFVLQADGPPAGVAVEQCAQLA